MTFGNRLKELRISAGLTQDELAAKLNSTKQSISRYENSDREPNIKTAKRIADVFGVNLETLVVHTPLSSSLPDNIIPMPTMGRVPLLGEIACGEPILAEENIAEYVDLPKHIKADFALRCRGDSMINARIFDGDVVYIRQQPDVADGEIAAVLIDQEATLKRVYHYPDRLELRPENPTVPVLQFEGAELATVRILGKAVAFTSPVR